MQCEKKKLILHPMNAKNVHLIYILLLLTGLFAGACRGDEDMEPRLPGSSGDTLSRTLIIYMAAENSLHSYFQTDSLEIAWGLDSLDEDCRVVLFMDDRLSTRLCVGTRKEPLQTVKTYEGNLCSTDSQTMVNVLKDIFHLYPARNYGLVLCSHGSGWIFDDPVASSQSVSRRSFGIDNGRRSSSNQGRRMNIPTLAGVLSGFPHFDYLFFDVCFMQCVEVAYELRHAADYIIASPAEIPATGAPYTKMLRAMCSTPADPAAIVDSYVDYYINDFGSYTYGGAEITAVRTDKLEQLARATAPLMNRQLAGRTEIDATNVQHYWPILSSAQYAGAYDLKNLFYHTLDSATYASWVRVFDEAVPVQRLTPTWFSAAQNGMILPVKDIPHCGGVSVYIPLEQHQSKGWNDHYHLLEWYRATGMSSTDW